MSVGENLRLEPTNTAVFDIFTSSENGCLLSINPTTASVLTLLERTVQRHPSAQKACGKQELRGVVKGDAE